MSTAVADLLISGAVQDDRGEDEVTEQQPIRYLADLYVNDRRRRGELSGKTPQNMACTLALFCDLVGPRRYPNTLRRADLEKWMARDAAPSTKMTQLSIIRTWVKWLLINGYTDHDPTVGLGRIKQPRYVPKAQSAEQVAKLLANLPDVRAELIVLLMVQCGLRCCEVANLEVNDVDFARWNMTVRGKGGHERTLPIVGSETQAAIQTYLAQYPAPAGPLIRSYRNPAEGLTSGYISEKLTAWGVAAGIRPLVSGKARGQLFSAHKLRHTCFTDMIDHGADIYTVQQAAGHRSVMTTQMYLGRRNLPDVRKAMEGRHYGGPHLTIVPDEQFEAM